MKVSLVGGAPRPIRVHESRPARRKRLKSLERKKRVVERMWAILKPTMAMDADEVTREAYHLYHKGLLTKKQARLVGCSLK